MAASRSFPDLAALGRGLALFLGSFTLINVAADLRNAGFDANLWWIDLRIAPPGAAKVFLAFCGCVLVGYGVTRGVRALRLPTLVTALLLITATAVNTVVVFHLLLRGEITSSFPIPFSFFVLAALLIVVASLRTVAETSPARLIFVAVSAATMFPLMQVLCFGLTDYRRAADAAIVLGARAYSDGTPSRPLAQRVATGAALYTSGVVPLLILSGGPGDGAIDEPEAMTRYASRLGVPRAAMIHDSAGVNTEATVRNTIVVADARDLRRLIVVSHFYHLPRIKMTYNRFGRDVITVPARVDRLTLDLVFNTFRELPALWVYYLRGVLR